MKYSALKLLAMLILLAFVGSSCGQNRWARYNSRSHYIDKKKYRSYHKHHNRDW